MSRTLEKRLQKYETELLTATGRRFSVIWTRIINLKARLGLSLDQPTELSPLPPVKVKSPKRKYKKRKGARTYDLARAADKRQQLAVLRTVNHLTKRKRALARRRKEL